MATNTGRKVRAHAKPEQLNAAQQERLRGCLEENAYWKVVEFVRQEFGISVGKSALSVYWRRHVLPEQQQDDAEIVAELTAPLGGDFDAATIQQARALAWDVLVRPFPDIDRAPKLLEMVYRAEQHALALKRLTLEERRVALREKLAGWSREPFKLGGSDEHGRVEGLQCDTQMYPPSTCSRLSLPEAAAPAKRQSEAPSAMQKLPRFPGYSELVQPQAEAGSPANCVKAEVGSETMNGRNGGRTSNSGH